MDIFKLKQLQDKINDEAIKEIIENIPPPFIQFSNSPTVKENLLTVKTGRKLTISARVLNNWINQEVVKVDKLDKGKINRFNRLESIWLNIANKARDFGFSLDSLKQSRKELFSEPVPNFSLLKFYVLDSMLRKSKILMISDDGHTNIISADTYTKWVLTGLLPAHLHFNLSEFLLPEFPNHFFNYDFGFIEPYQDTNKCKLLYYLKTGDYKLIKVYIINTDVRLIESTNSLIENPSLLESLRNLDFEKAIITTNNNNEDIIYSKS
jgi:hypothetical protein